MSNQYPSLKEFFTNIANSIRSKTGKTDSIIADDFPIAVENIETVNEAIIRKETAETKAAENEVLFERMITRELANYVIPDGIKKIGDNAFSYCAISEITFPESLVEIGGSAFLNCFILETLNLPEGLQKCGMYITKNSSIKRLVIPSTYGEKVGASYTISNGTFRESNNLEYLEVKKGILNDLGVYCFYNCSKLKEIHLPNTIINTNSNSFGGCKKLEFVYLEDGFKSSLNISASTLYSVETLVAMLEALADLTGQTAKTLTIGATNLAKLTEEQIAIATNKNWTLA